MLISDELVLSEEDPLLVGSKIIKERKLEEVRYPCDKCEYAATSTWDLSRHIKSYHEGVRYPCDKCVNTLQLQPGKLEDILKDITKE